MRTMRFRYNRRRKIQAAEEWQRASVRLLWMRQDEGQELQGRVHQRGGSAQAVPASTLRKKGQNRRRRYRYPKLCEVSPARRKRHREARAAWLSQRQNPT